MFVSLQILQKGKKCIFPKLLILSHIVGFYRFDGGVLSTHGNIIRLCTGYLVVDLNASLKTPHYKPGVWELGGVNVPFIQVS